MNPDESQPQNHSTHLHLPPTVNPDGSKDRESPKSRGADEFRKGTGLSPGDVAHRVFGPNPEGTESPEIGRAEVAQAQRQMIVAAGFLPPVEIESLDVLQQAGWRRIPIRLQNLPAQLMGSAWWHEEEGLVLLDARKPNFKKTAFGALPIDLILGDLTPDMREQLA